MLHAAAWLAVFLLAAHAAFAQSNANVRVTGHAAGSYGPGLIPGDRELWFECTGYPTCRGTFINRESNADCPNGYLTSNGFELTGLELGQRSQFQGVATLKQDSYPGNRCSVPAPPLFDRSVPYTGSWDGVSEGTIAIRLVTGGLTAQGTFKADALPPVFPMTVTTTINNGIATSNANVQFRPQDVGTQGSVFVFAMAPMSVVKDAVVDRDAPMQWFFRRSEKDLPVQCVLAQLSASGQLVGVSASTLQAYVTGVLSSQGVAVTILNGVPTVNIGGATFFVGYGTSGQSMLNGGINRAAVTIPGAQVCEPTAPQTGWWWNPLEDGRGFSVEKRGPNMFVASFLYDASGRSTWYVSSGLSSLEGSLYVGDLLAASGGQTLGGPYPGFPRLDKAGTVTITFNSATNGTIVWPGGTVPIQRQPFVPNGLALAPMPGGPEGGWWWNEAEAGRGFFMEFQGDWLDVAGYMYDEQGNTVWYLTVAQMSGTNQQTFNGNWWSFANGQTLTGAWKPNTRTSDHVAPVTITFSGADTALMTLPNGRTTALKRHRF